MLCSKYKIFYGLLPLFLLFFSFFFSSFSVNDTYAVEDIVKIVDSSNYSSSGSALNPICDSNCSSYKYLIIEPFNFTESSFISWFVQFYFNINWLEPGSSNSRTYPTGIYGPPSRSVFELKSPSDTYTLLNAIYFQNIYNSNVMSSLNSDWSIKVTLSENNPDASGITPSGSIELTENGTYDVTNYAEAVVNVPESSGGGSGGNYHEDLVNIYHAIMICGAIVLVLYFFYCIYRVIIKSTGGK